MDIEKVTIEDGQSADLVNENLEQLKNIFPEAFTEDGVDFATLRQLLGDTKVLDEGDERYSFNWHGKKVARQLALTPSTGTLLPCPEESVDWDNTKNLFIEGDNLEVLKLLQKSYANKVKMIYIDPPYNTGKDFVYKDSFGDNIKNYLELTGQTDEEGAKISSNTESGGRYHTNWLNLMYPRLKLARNLLKENGVIFISIDEIEQSNLIKICDEIFGEENHIADFVWQNKKGGGNDAKYVAVEHEYIVMYAKSEVCLHNLFEPYKPEYLKRYKEQDEKGKFFWDTFKRKSGKQYYPITAPDGAVLKIDKNGNPISWLRSEARFKQDLTEGEVRFVGGNGKWSIHFKQRLPQGKKPRSIFLSDSIWADTGTTSDGSLGVLELFGKDVFDNPKPLKLLQKLIGFNLNKGELILDFFAGSSTTAHSLFLDNVCNDIKDRNFILVQLPEAINDKTEPSKNALSLGFKSLSKLSIERIRRAAVKIKEENTEYKGDLGFKVFKLSTSNIRAWNPTGNIEDDLFKHKEHLIEGRSEDDILYELLVKRGVELTTPIQERIFADKKVYCIGYGVSFACLAESIEMEDIDELSNGIIAWHEECSLDDGVLVHVFFRDSAFADNRVKTNMAETLKQRGINHVKSL